VTQPDPKPLYASEQGDVEQKRQQLREALTDHEPKLRDAAQAYVYALGLAREPSQVAELSREAVQSAAQRVLEEAHAYQMNQSPYPWLRKFVYNAVRTLRSKRLIERRHLSLVLDTATAQSARAQALENVTEEELLARLWAAKSNPEQQLEWREIFQLMHPEDRLVLELYLDDYTGEALAAELTKRLGTTIRRGTADTRLLVQRAVFPMPIGCIDR
jgi:sugar-specific transcriptional regulator TrmB